MINHYFLIFLMFTIQRITQSKVARLLNNAPSTLPYRDVDVENLEWKP